jgi:hypothetical protein
LNASEVEQAYIFGYKAKAWSLYKDSLIFYAVDPQIYVPLVFGVVGDTKFDKFSSKHGGTSVGGIHQCLRPRHLEHSTFCTVSLSHGNSPLVHCDG